MPHPRPRFRGRLIRRYKRFLADVVLDDGRELTVHCPSPGAMTGCAEPSSRILVSDSGNPKRRLRYTWELVRCPGTWVGINSSRANAVVGEALDRGAIAELGGYTGWTSEVTCGSSRIDWLLTAGERRCWLEVKTATLAEARVAMFPDAVTGRGLRHLQVLTERVEAGDRAAVLFVVNREDCDRFRAAGQIDPAYAAGLRRAAAAGVLVLAYAARVRVPGIELAAPVPVDLG